MHVSICTQSASLTTRGGHVEKSRLETVPVLCHYLLHVSMPLVGKEESPLSRFDIQDLILKLLKCSHGLLLLLWLEHHLYH